MNRITNASVRTMLVLLIISAGFAVAEDFELSRSTTDGGGVMFSSGADFELSGTIGQPDAGIMSGGDFELSGGFWFPLAPTDCNSDGGVDLSDYGDVEPCLSGPDGGLLYPDCNCFDVDGDSDVDMADVARFQAAFTGG